MLAPEVALGFGVLVTFGVPVAFEELFELLLELLPELVFPVIVLTGAAVAVAVGPMLGVAVAFAFSEAVTFTLQVNFFPFTFAYTFALPTFFAVTFPFLVTLTIFPLLTLHFTVFFVPFTFNCILCPTFILRLVLLNFILAASAVIPFAGTIEPIVAVAIATAIVIAINVLPCFFIILFLPFLS